MKFGYTINNKLMMNSNGKLIGVDPYNPLNLPQGTIRVRTNDGQPPVNGHYVSATLVEGTTDVYDVYKSGDDLSLFLEYSYNVVDVLGGNTNNITNMSMMFSHCGSLSSVSLFDTSNVSNMSDMFQTCSSLSSVPLFNTRNVTNISDMFWDCNSLTTLPLFDTSNVTDTTFMFYKCKSLTSAPLLDTSKVLNMYGMFLRCDSLTAIPLFDVSNVTNMANAFYGCYNVQSGALDLYREASSQPNVTGHYETFKNCGINTETGSAELAQIPSDWK